MHDDRGAASIEWLEAPSNYERPVFELALDEAKKKDTTFNPYEREGDTFSGRRPPAGVEPKSGKRDLRKLSEWMKLMKAMEERKKNGDE